MAQKKQHRFKNLSISSPTSGSYYANEKRMEMVNQRPISTYNAKENQNPPYTNLAPTTAASLEILGKLKKPKENTESAQELKENTENAQEPLVNLNITDNSNEITSTQSKNKKNSQSKIVIEDTFLSQSNNNDSYLSQQKDQLHFQATNITYDQMNEEGDLNSPTSMVNSRFVIFSRKMKDIDDREISKDIRYSTAENKKYETFYAHQIQKESADIVDDCREKLKTAKSPNERLALNLKMYNEYAKMDQDFISKYSGLGENEKKLLSLISEIRHLQKLISIYSDPTLTGQTKEDAVKQISIIQPQLDEKQTKLMKNPDFLVLHVDNNSLYTTEANKTTTESAKKNKSDVSATEILQENIDKVNKRFEKEYPKDFNTISSSILSEILKSWLYHIDPKTYTKEILGKKTLEELEIQALEVNSSIIPNYDKKQVLRLVAKLGINYDSPVYKQNLHDLIDTLKENYQLDLDTIIMIRTYYEKIKRHDSYIETKKFNTELQKQLDEQKKNPKSFDVEPIENANQYQGQQASFSCYAVSASNLVNAFLKKNAVNEFYFWGQDKNPDFQIDKLKAIKEKQNNKKETLEEAFSEYFIEMQNIKNFMKDSNSYMGNVVALADKLLEATDNKAAVRSMRFDLQSSTSQKAIALQQDVFLEEVYKALTVHHSPVSVLNGNHYLTIVGIKGRTLLVKNPSNKSQPETIQHLDLDNLFNANKPSGNAKGNLRGGVVEIAWLQELNKESLDQMKKEHPDLSTNYKNYDNKDSIEEYELPHTKGVDYSYQVKPNNMVLNDMIRGYIYLPKKMPEGITI